MVAARSDDRTNRPITDTLRACRTRPVSSFMSVPPNRFTERASDRVTPRAASIPGTSRKDHYASYDYAVYRPGRRGSIRPLTPYERRLAHRSPPHRSGTDHTIRIFPNRCRNSRSLNRHRPSKYANFASSASMMRVEVSRFNIPHVNAALRRTLQEMPCGGIIATLSNGDHRASFRPNPFATDTCICPLFGHFDTVRAIGAAIRVSAM